MKVSSFSKNLKLINRGDHEWAMYDETTGHTVVFYKSEIRHGMYCISWFDTPVETLEAISANKVLKAQLNGACESWKTAKFVVASILNTLRGQETQEA